jgi:hypothetical protein
VGTHASDAPRRALAPMASLTNPSFPRSAWGTQVSDAQRRALAPMASLTIQFPHSLVRSIQALDDEEDYSIDQFLASAAAEKMAALRTLAYLRNEAAAGRREDFDRFLSAVPDREPTESDRLVE